MKRVIRSTIAFVTAFIMAFTGAFMFNGIGNAVYASVGSVADDEDVQYDKDGGVLESLGFDTSKKPEDYDPDSTENPYGSDMTNLSEVKEYINFNKNNSTVHGHDAKLDGKYDTLIDGGKKITHDVGFFTSDSPYADTVACDVSGSGRKSGLAIVYTNYDSTVAGSDQGIYLTLYDPHNGINSDPIRISTIMGDKIKMPFLIQSQMQITCGDYDNDSVDEVAVYVPAADDNQRPKVSVYDLINGKESENPYEASEWRLAWNYILPMTSSEVVASQTGGYLRNFYNNIDLASGDADNDGICDMILSYGASSTNAEHNEKYWDKVYRSIKSKSVLLYGNDGGQMLKDTQEISYGDDDLIRVSFAFGDLDDDGNEEMILGGQVKDHQISNTARVLGKYTYDNGSGKMIPERIQEMAVIDGSWEGDTFNSANGWDGRYRTMPIMNTNLVVGKIYGMTSKNRIYMDSVIYSYDNIFAIEDELEDDSEEYDKYGKKKPKGSCALTDIYVAGATNYYEYGAQIGNFTGGDYDYILLNRVTKPYPNHAYKMHAHRTILAVKGENLEDLKMEGHHMFHFYNDEMKGSPFIMASADTDVDGIVAEYTGKHKIIYDNPKVDAVLVSAPYFKDVAAYDEGAMLGGCSTGYGKSKGEDKGYEHTISAEIGIVGGVEATGPTGHGFFVNAGAGFSASFSWGEDTNKEFTVSYETGGGEDAVVLYSIPRQYFEYKVRGVTVDEDGNMESYESKMYITFPHQPVTQTLTVEDYMDIQKEYSGVLPDVTKYYSSSVGDPSSYPKNEGDIPSAASANLKRDEDGKELKYSAKDFAGIAYGGGKISQSFSVTTTTSEFGDNYQLGGYFNIEGGYLFSKSVMGVSIGARGGAHGAISYTNGSKRSVSKTNTYSCTVANMPRSAKDYGYDFSWKLFEYNVSFKPDEKITDSREDDEKDKKDKDDGYHFPIVTYIVDDVLSPPALPDEISQDFDNTTDSQTALTWTYNTGTPKEFDVYKYLDFPQGGGDILIGKVAGSDYRIKKDENGNTIKDSKGNVIHEYTFIDKNLTADTKYRYRIKVKRSAFPQESIFSPVIEARTDVSRKPDISLSSNRMKIYPDGIYKLTTMLADPENYEGTINYQWQRYDEKKRIWNDVNGCTKKTIAFYRCEKDDEGTYRCRVNLVRKVESHPQYISTYTDPCIVEYSKRTVSFGPIDVFEGTGSSPVNTGVSVSLYNTSGSSVEKPTGVVGFTIEGANSTMYIAADIDETTGLAKIDSLEDAMDTSTLKEFTDGGYKVTASYFGSKIFYAADDPEDYHYLRNIDECIWLSARSTYVFGEDLMRSVGLYDYKKDGNGSIVRTDITEKIKALKFYKTDEKGKRTGDALVTYDLSETGGKAPLPLHYDLAKSAFVEVFDNEAASGEPAGSASIKTEKMLTGLDLRDRMTGTGDNLELYSDDDIELTGEGDLAEKNIITSGGTMSLADLLRIRYYESSGDYMFDSTTAADHKDEFVPAAYVVKLGTAKVNDVDLVNLFYKLDLKPGDFTVVGNYYKVDAACSDENAGVVSMISPDRKAEFAETGYAGGTKLVFKAVPNRGYKVKQWRIDECGQNAYTLPASDTITYTVKSQNISGNGKITIRADLEAKDNVLNYGAKGNGTVEITPNIESGSMVIADTPLTFKATPDKGWKFHEWKWINDGGNNSVAKGTMAEDGTNTKTFVMPDNTLSMYGIFMKETIDLELKGALTAAYINDGSNPMEETGKKITTDSGLDVPRGTQVIVSTRKGYGLAPDAEWKVTITTPDGTYDAEIEEFISGGQESCRFALPEDVTACTVSADTEKGRFAVNASADDVQFAIKVDGVKADGQSVSGIESGSDIEITAIPDRGKKLKNWKINGDFIESSDLIYTTTIDENLSVTATTVDDTKLSLKLKTTGGGQAKYVITDKNGKTYKGDFGETEITPELYKGESLVLRAADGETKHTMTAVSVNGRNRALEDDNLELKDISEDLDIICRFTPSAYCKLDFTQDMRKGEAVILDGDGKAVEAGKAIMVPWSGSVSFKVSVPKDIKCYVYDGEEVIKSDTKDTEDPDRDIYGYKLDDVDRNMSLTVRDYAPPVYIDNREELLAYFEAIKNDPDNCPDAVLRSDIVLDDEDKLKSPNYGYTGVFDGQGHTISGGKSESGLFGRVEGCVKDVVLEDMVAEAGRAISSSFLASDNYGTISGVQLRNVRVTQESVTSNHVMTGIALDNHGTIKDCEVTGLKLIADQQYFNSYIACAGVSINSSNGMMENNYFEGLEVTTPEGLVPATGSIVANNKYTQAGGFRNNWFKAQYETNDKFGRNVCDLTEDPENKEKALAEVDTPAFAKKLAYRMNKDCGEKIWGVARDVDKTITQIHNAHGAKAPIKVDFKVGDKAVTRYCFPGECRMPGSEDFGDPTPKAWVYGDRAYASEAMCYDIVEDAVLRGIGDLGEYVATISSTPDTAKTYFKDLNEALAAASIHNSTDPQVLTIIGECEMADVTFTIDTKTTVVVADGSKLTIKKTADIVNNGSLVCSEGSEIHKYGNIQNNGTIVIGGDFHNYGSRLVGKGTITGRDTINCKPHCSGSLIQKEKPNDDGTWDMTSTCEVCGHDYVEKIDPDPAAGTIDCIKLLSEPDREAYEVGDSFTDKGMKVIAERTDGRKAVVTKYTMYSGDKSNRIENGMVLDKDGDIPVTVAYEGLTCGFDIEVRNTKDLLTLTDGGGDEISETEMIKGASLDLTASLKHSLPYKYGFQWTSSDPAVAGIYGDDVSMDRSIRALTPGKATITVVVTDEKGNPIQAIDPKTVEITVVSHVTSLEIIGGDKTIDVGSSYPLNVKVAPTDYTDKLVWKSTNEAVASVDEKGVVTANRGGQAVITVTSPDGVSASCRVTTYEKAGEMVLDATELAVSKGGFNVISARVTPATANGEVTWTTADVAIAGFCVTDEKTGETKVVDKVTTKLSADGNDCSDTYVIVAGASDGEFDITASTAGRDGSTITKDCKVKVSTGETVLITHNGASASGMTMKMDLKGGYVRLDAESSVDNDTLTWSAVDDESNPVIKVDSIGNVSFKRTGTAVVRVKSETTGATDVCMIRVIVPATGITLSEKVATLTRGDVRKLIATLEPADADGDLTWKTTDDSVVRVSETGEVTAVGAGAATVTVDTGYGGVSASCKITVNEPVVNKIVPKATKIKKLKKGKKSIKVKWARVNAKVASRHITGYQIQVATNKKFTRNKKTVTVKGYKKTTKKIKKLKAKKRYFVRIRTYVVVDGVTHYSSWSKVKKIKTKR